jgi:hypothetical protein
VIGVPGNAVSATITGEAQHRNGFCRHLHQFDALVIGVGNDSSVHPAGIKNRMTQRPA